MEHSDLSPFVFLLRSNNCTQILLSTSENAALLSFVKYLKPKGALFRGWLITFKTSF